MTTELTIEEHGVMLSDYFSGTPGVMLPLSIDKNTTIYEVITMLEDEINMVWDLIESTAKHHNFKGDLEKAINVELAVINKFCRNKLNQKYGSSLEWKFNELSLDYEEFPVLIFTIEFN